jgi:hypothetical protein
MKALIRLSLLAALLCSIASVPEAHATNLRPGHLAQPVEAFIFESLHTAFYIRNDSSFAADGYPIYVAVQDPKGAIIFRDTVIGTLVVARDSIRIDLTKSWQAQLSGRYTIHVDVEYAEDVKPQDNVRDYSLAVFDSDGHVEQYQQSPFITQVFENPGLFFYTVPASSTPTFINVYPYQVPSGGPVNVPLVHDLWAPARTEPTTYSQQIDLTKLKIPHDSIADIIRLILFETSVPVGDTPPPIDQAKFEQLAVKHTFFNMFDDGIAGGGGTEIIPVPPARPVNTAPVFKDTVFRANMPNVDLDSTHNNPGTVPGYAGDKNACGPAAAANSMHWLELEHPEIHSDSSLRAKLVELSALMQRATEQGVSTQQLVRGKLSFIDKHKLPIHVKFQSFYVKADSTVISSPDPKYNHSATNQSDLTHAYPRTTYRQLYNEMKNGEDVEVMGGWYDPTGKRHGGHWFAVNSIGLVNGTPHILISHDRDQSKTGGLQNNEEMTLDTNSDPEGAVVREWCDSTKKTTFIIESIVSESYDPAITFATGAVYSPGSPRLSAVLRSSRIAANEQPVILFDAPNTMRVTMEVYDVLGRKVYESESLIGAGTSDKTLDLRNIAAGTYLITVRSGELKQDMRLIIE